MSTPFMQLYVADYLGDTRHLTTEQHGAYMLLLMTMWRADGRLSSDPKILARLAGCTASRWAKISAEVMAFFDVEGDHVTNRRLGLELKKAQEKSIKRAIVGSAGGNAKALKNNKPKVAIATGLLKHSSEPEPEKNSATDVAAHAEKIDLDPDAQAWALGVELLTKRGGLSERQSRAFLGGLFKRFAIRASELLVAIIHAEDSGTHDLQPYLTASAQALKGLRVVHARGPPTPGQLAIEAREEGRRRLLAEEDDGDAGRNYQRN